MTDLDELNIILPFMERKKMTRQVLCDRCKKDAGYTSDWKRPPYLKISEKDKVYEILKAKGYEDICVSCFNLFHNRHDLAVEKLFAEFKNTIWLTEEQKKLALLDATARTEKLQSHFESFSGKNCDDCSGWTVGESR